MGLAASKTETKVFTPSAPVEYSPLLLQQLENSPDTNYTRAQQSEKYIQDRVASELQKLEREAIAQFQESSKVATESAGGTSVAALNEKIDRLTKTLEENAKQAQVTLSDEVKTARQAVVACLKSNKGRSLNCWDEVEHFKQLVHGL